MSPLCVSWLGRGVPCCAVCGCVSLCCVLVCASRNARHSSCPLFVACAPGRVSCAFKCLCCVCACVRLRHRACDPAPGGKEGGGSRRADAIDRRDNLAAFMYEQVFAYVVAKINSAVHAAAIADGVGAPVVGRDDVPFTLVDGFGCVARGGGVGARADSRCGAMPPGLHV